MADGGASTFIMLITGLLISSSVSALLITEWSAMARAAQKDQQGVQFSNELGVEFAGDPMMVDLNTSANPQEITFYLQNTGEHPMDESVIEVLVNGLAPTTITPFLITGTTWDPGELVAIQIKDSDYATNADISEGEDVRIFAIVTSDSVGGMSSSTTMSVEVRLS
tara:strand:- start:15 stop:512 length:498 start_codon:yes stop_codon:yes gene_type:complete